MDFCQDNSRPPGPQRESPTPSKNPSHWRTEFKDPYEISTAIKHGREADASRCRGAPTEGPPEPSEHRCIMVLRGLVGLRLGPHDAER